MQWSAIPPRKKNLYIGLAVVAAAALAVVGTLNNSKRQVGADTVGSSLTVDSEIGLNEVKFLVVDAANTPQAGAYLDIFSVTTEEGYSTAVDQEGRTTVYLPSDCYAVKASPTAGGGEGAIVLAVDVNPATCGEGAVTAIKGETVNIITKK